MESTMGNVKPLINESYDEVEGVKDLPSDATKAGEIVKKLGSKLTQVKVRSAIVVGTTLYKDLDDFLSNGKFAGSGVFRDNFLGYAYKVNGKNDTLFGYKDWGTFNKDYVLIFIPDTGVKKAYGLVSVSDEDKKEFLGWNYAWIDEIAVM